MNLFLTSSSDNLLMYCFHQIHTAPTFKSKIIQLQQARTPRVRDKHKGSWLQCWQFTPHRSALLVLKSVFCFTCISLMVKKDCKSCLMLGFSLVSFLIFCVWFTEIIRVCLIHFSQIFRTNYIIFPTFYFDFGILQIVQTIMSIEHILWSTVKFCSKQQPCGFWSWTGTFWIRNFVK